MGTLIVNKFGQLEVMNYAGDTQIGKLVLNEAFAHSSNQDSMRWIIKFRNSSGQAATGYLDTAGVGSLPSWSDYPISTVTLYDYATGRDIEHYVYNVRRTSTIYNASATALSTKISAGGAVAVPAGEAGESGSSHPDWMLIRYVKTSSTGSWQSLYNLHKVYYGYVPIGLEYGSGESTLSVYGNW